MKNCKDYLSIFLVPPSLRELERRIRCRQTESEEVIQKRMNKARNELEVVADYQYAVVNTTPKEAARRIREIILENLNK